MSGFPLILAFVAAIVLMILAISKWKIHPFLSIMGISLVLGLVAGVPLVNRTAADGAVTPGLFAGRLAWMYSHAACVYIARSVLIGQFLLFSLCSKRF